MSFTAQPQSQTNIAGTPTTFCVTATGTAPLSYQWRSNGVALAAATSSCYVLPNTQPFHAANYDAVVANVAGSRTSQVASLTVRVKPTITAPPQDRTNVVGTPAVFRVTASGTAPLSYQWRSNDVPLAGATASAYSIASVLLTHAAGYSAMVTNVAGSIASSVATLTVSNAASSESWVIRQLPAYYQPQTALTVTLAATPVPSSTAYAVQERPPANWAVTNISDGGEFTGGAEAGDQRV